MSATALAVINHSSTKPTLNETFQSLANSALLGARGNSGMIFSQFFSGLTETSLSSDQLDTTAFAELITKASKSVRSAILHPVEGTILTVIDAWSASMTKLSKELSCFKQLIKHTLTEVHQALQSTTDLLLVLKDAQVVDAGALGFYHFITGFSEYLINPHLINKQDASHPCAIAHHESFEHTKRPHHRYCTEITLAGESLHRDALAHLLEPYGDSIVSSGNASLCRFHIHCTDPAELFESFSTKGQITHSKADDMLRQFEMIHQQKYPIALVTDSSADLPKTLLDEFQIHQIPLNMHLDGHHLLDRLCVNQEKFYDRLATLTPYPKTSFPSPALIETQLTQLSRHYEHVLVLPIAQALSGTHDAIVKASEGLKNVHTMNTCLTSAGLGLLIAHAADRIANHDPIESIKHALTLKIPKINFFVYVANFDALIRCGRVKKLSGLIAQFAHIKPIISLDPLGQGILTGKTFSETKAFHKLIHHVKTLSQKSPLEAYGLVHAGAPKQVMQFAALTEEAFGMAPAFIESTSTAIGLHAGKGSVAIASMLR